MLKFRRAEEAGREFRRRLKAAAETLTGTLAANSHGQ